MGLTMPPYTFRPGQLEALASELAHQAAVFGGPLRFPLRFFVRDVAAGARMTPQTAGRALQGVDESPPAVAPHLEPLGYRVSGYYAGYWSGTGAARVYVPAHVQLEAV
jgi:hypothetical protein